MFGGSDLALSILLVVSTITDLIWGKIYNWLTFSFFFLGILLSFSQIIPEQTGVNALLSILVALALFLPLYATGVVAAGDVKLLMAYAAWRTPSLVLQMAGLSIVVGAVVGLGILLQQRGIFQIISGTFSSLSKKSDTGHRMPFAPAFLIAFLILHVALERNWSLGM